MALDGRLPRKRAERAALTGNAADEQQVENAKREERNQRDIDLDDLAGLLELPHFRRLVWRFWEYAGPFRSPMGLTDSDTNHRAGLGDAGRWLLKEITLAAPAALTEMMTEFGEHA